MNDKKVIFNEQYNDSQKEYHNMTLEHYLLITYPEYSRSYMSKLIKSGMVAVNDIVSDSRLKRIIHNDKVEIEFRDKVGDTILSENIPFEIIFENDDLLVINKEEGVVVHPGAGQESGTLLNAVKHYLKEDSQPVMVNRIDKETSGIVLVAKLQNLEKFTQNSLKIGRSVRHTFV